MSLPKFLTLLVIVGCLLAYIYKVEMPASERQVIEKKPFSGSSREQIKKISITKKDQPAYIFENTQAKYPAQPGQEKSAPAQSKAEDWSIDGLDKAALDSSTLNSLLSQLLSADLGAALPQTELDKDLAKYGLASPEAIVTVDRVEAGEKIDTIKFEFGKKSDYLAKRFVRLTRPDSSQDFFLTDDLLFFAANKDIKDFRDKTPLKLAENDIQQIHLHSPKGDIILDRMASTTPGKAGTVWKVSKPFVATADQSVVADLFHSLGGLRVKDFFDKDAAEQKKKLLEKPDVVIDLAPKSDAKDQTPIQIKFATVSEPADKATDQKNKSTLFFSTSVLPSVFQAESDSLVAFDKEPAAYRETQFFRFEESDVTAVTLAGSLAPAITMTKAGEHWKIGDKNGDEVFIREWLLEASQIKAEGFPDSSAKFGFDAPSYRLSLTMGTLLPGADKDAKKTERVLVVGAPASRSPDGQVESYFAAVDDLSEPFLLGRAALEKIIPKLDALTEAPTPAAVPASTPASVTPQATP